MLTTTLRIRLWKSQSDNACKRCDCILDPLEYSPIVFYIQELCFYHQYGISRLERGFFRNRIDTNLWLSFSCQDGTSLVAWFPYMVLAEFYFSNFRTLPSLKPGQEEVRGPQTSASWPLLPVAGCRGEESVAKEFRRN